jgi:hypothetical protein
MKFLFLASTSLVCGAAALAQGSSTRAPELADGVAQLPQLIVYSPRVANQAPLGTFPMPVSALRYEPRVDIQGRNLAEAQADVTIRGGIFENTGFTVGGVTLTDPQTGHYLAELPIAPQMLSAPEILTGAELASAATNATVGAVAYDWRRIQNYGAALTGFGPHGLWRGDVYQGFTTSAGPGAQMGADVELAHSESNGPIAFGDHQFDRVNARLQFSTQNAQTDLFAGYQAKFFGWPNLYTPFNSNESENLETLLLAASHRINLGAGDFVSLAAYHRRNKDDYAYNRFAPLGPVHPFQHTTWENGAALSARRDVGGVIVNARAEVLADFLKSTSLTAGRYHSRTLTKAALVPEKSWADGEGALFTVKAGATLDDSNRDHSKVSPVAELAQSYNQGALRRIYASYAQTTQEASYTALNSSAASGLFRGNPNLGRQITRNLELGVNGVAGEWTTQAALFARRDHSLTDWTFRRGVTARTANAVDIDTVGFEALTRRSWHAIDLVFGYTLLTKDADYRGATVDASFYALNYARQRLTAAMTVRLGYGLELRMDNVARVQSPNLLRTVGGDRTVFSTVALAYRPLAWRGVEVSVQLDNLWNSRFQEIPAVPATPRQWSVGASYVW